MCLQYICYIYVFYSLPNSEAQRIVQNATEPKFDLLVG